MASGASKSFRFIPFRRSDLAQMLRAKLDLSGDDATLFERGVERIDQVLVSEFNALRRELKDVYAAFDPDADTRVVELATNQESDPTELSRLLATVLDRGNYEQLSDADLKRAFRSVSLFEIRLKVDLSDFDEVMIFCRGASERKETLRGLLGFSKREVSFLNYERVVLFLRFADRAATDGKDLSEEHPSGRVMIKLFQNVPSADLEMLFPNTRVAMRWRDRLLMGVPALVSGAVVAFTKLGAPLLLLAGLFGYWLGVQNEPVVLDKKGLLALGAGGGALAAYLWKQWSSYRNRKAKFRQTLTRNLYFRLLDNNGGVLLRVLDDAEESECKEAYTALYFLIAAQDGLSAADLDAAIESWFEQSWSATLDFEITDALEKLDRIGLATERDGRWYASTSDLMPQS